MSRRVLILLLLCLPAIAGPATAAQKPILIVVKSRQCPPCANFAFVWSASRELREALTDAFEMRELSWDLPLERAEAIRLGARAVPTFIALRGTRRIAISEGFAPTIDRETVQQATAELMRDLGVEWPRPQSAGTPATPRAQPATDRPPVTAPDPVVRPAGETIDRTARDGVAKLITQSSELRDAQHKTQSAVQTLQTDVGAVRAKISDVETQVEQTRRQLGTQLRESHDSTTDAIRSMAGNLRESFERSRDTQSPAGESRGPIRDANPTIFDTPRTPNISTEISTGQTASKWLAVGGWIAKTAVTVAAPEIAIPASAGLSVLGLAIGFWKKRNAARAPAPIGSASNPITVNTSGPVRTETKFVVSESDILGEAYAEAIRRVGNHHRESQPYVVDLLKQVDGCAQQIAHGQRTVRRPLVSSESLPLG